DAATGTADAHSMTPEAVFGLLRSMGGTPRRVWIVGCEPLSLEEKMGLSAPVEQAVDEAVALVLDVIAREGREETERAENVAGAVAGPLHEESA
ncbi:MAG TPA: hypothetical protein VMM92_03390, partial [Thermoanaerobaculia bacterium]|nr:hypothetical protein [Thermoanaerobaculia bacterium]